MVETPVKLEFIKRLADSGLQHIEATSFVSPSKVPQVKILYSFYGLEDIFKFCICQYK